MAQRSKEDFKSTKNTRFADNSTGDISAQDSRDMYEDVADSVMFLDDNFIDEDSFASNSDTKAPSQRSVKAFVDTHFTVHTQTTAGETVTLDMLNLPVLAFKGDANISENKDVAISNDGAATEIRFFTFQASANVQLTFESDVRHNVWDGAWNSDTGLIWTAPADGVYIMKASRADSLWFVEILGPYPTT